MIVLASHIIVGSITIFVILIVATYVIAVVNRHVTPIVPFISHAGNTPFESCIFSLSFNFATIISIFTVHVRYFQLLDALNNPEAEQIYNRRMRRLNLKSLVYGWLGSLGLSIVGNFQQRLSRPVHLTGFFLVIIFLYIYMINQTYFSFTLLSTVTSRAVKRCRLAFVIICTIIFLLSPALFIYNFFVLKQRFITVDVYPLFQPNWVKMTGAVFEWTVFFMVLAFVCTFYSDFKMISIEKDRITLLR